MTNALHAITSALPKTRMLNPVVHAPHGDTEQESMLKKFDLEESIIFQTVTHLFASEKEGATDRPVDTNPYVSVQAVVGIEDAKTELNERNKIMDSAVDTLIKKDNSINSLATWTGPAALKPRLEEGYKKQAIKIIEDASKELDEHHERLISLAGKTNKFTDPKARDEYVDWLLSALLFGISDRADQAQRIAQYRTNPLIEIVAGRKKIDHEIGQLQEIDKKIDEKEKELDSTPPEDEEEDSLESLYSQFNEKYALAETLHTNLKEMIKEKFPGIARQFWEIFPLVHETIKMHVECQHAGRLQSPMQSRLKGVLTSLLSRVFNFQATFKEEVSPLIRAGVMSNLSVEHKKKNVSISRETQMPTLDYSQLSWSSRFVKELEDIHVYESVVGAGVSSFLGMPEEKRNEDGRQTALDFGSKLVEVGNAYRDLRLNLEKRFSDRKLAALPEESRQDLQEKRKQISLELEYRSYLFEATAFILSTYAENFVPLAPEKEPAEDQTLVHIHEIQQSLNEVGPEEKSADEPEPAAAGEPMVHEDPDEAQEIIQSDSTVKDTEKSAVSDRTSSPERTPESRQEKKTDAPKKTRVEAPAPTAAALLAEASTLYESFKDYCKKAESELSRHEEASNFLSGTKALFTVANHYTEAAQCCNEAQLRLRDAKRSHLPLINVREKPVGIKELKEKCAYYLDEALLNFGLAHDPRSKRPNENNLKKIDEKEEIQLDRPSNFYRRVGIDTPEESMIVEGKISYSAFKCAEVERSLPVNAEICRARAFRQGLEAC